MSTLLLGQVLGVSFACGLNLYLTVAALGILSRVGVLQSLPPGLQGLEGLIVIASAATLFLVESVIDKVRHADSLWDTVHTFIRPPAAALLAIGIMWGQAPGSAVTAAAIAFFTALAAHGTKAGVRLALNAGMRTGRAWVSIGEDVLAVAFATMAFLDPATALIGTGVVLVLILLVGPRYWRAFRLGLRALTAWVRTLFSPARWREADELPRSIRTALPDVPLGTAPPRGTRAAIHGLRGTGAYRNGWLVITTDGPVFVYRTLLGSRRLDLPTPTHVRADRGVWTDMVEIEAGEDTQYRLYLLKDGPTLDAALPHLQHTTA